jgi:hypothetical protein
MDIIIFGLILFILAVGSTFLYDKHKDDVIAIFKDKKNKREKYLKSSPPRPLSTNKTYEDPNEEFLRKFKESITSKKSQEQVINELLKLNEKLKQPSVGVKPKITIDPNSLNFGLYKEGDMPTQAKYMEELFDDVSINSTMTIQELITKIEKLKGRSGPKG